MNDKVKKILKEAIPYIIILVVVILIRTFIATPVKVHGDSMRKNLDDGEILILYKLANIERYDVVVAEVNEEDGDIIKRVYGLPGDTIEIKDNVIFINDQEINDEYAYGETEDMEKITLKKDEYFILGDNRLISKDSRVFGPVNEDEIKGKTILKIFPFKKINKL